MVRLNCVCAVNIVYFVKYAVDIMCTPYNYKYIYLYILIYDLKYTCQRRPSQVRDEAKQKTIR